MKITPCDLHFFWYFESKGGSLSLSTKLKKCHFTHETLTGLSRDLYETFTGR
jgi:hypothetical protein